LLKTLEEPAEFIHLVLLSSEPAALLETVISRCREVEFSPLSAAAVEEALAERSDADELERRAATRLCGGDVDTGEYLLSEPGRRLRRAAGESIRAAREGGAESAPWRELLTSAEEAGAGEAERVEEAVLAEAEESGEPKAKTRARKAATEAAKRAGRRARTEILDLGLALCTMWARDLAATTEGSGELAYNADRAAELERLAAGLDPVAARQAGERIMDTRARLRVNVSEELALESLFFGLEELLGPPA
ncbi:MAG: hypothetical protein ACR2N5_01485, partial [Solirubrobacterales bacterium]